MLNAKDLLQYVPSETVFQLKLLDLATQAGVAVFERNGNLGDDNGPLNATLSMLEANFSNLENELAGFQGSRIVCCC